MILNLLYITSSFNIPTNVFITGSLFQLFCSFKEATYFILEYIHMRI